MSRHLQHMAVVATATMGSRFLGLFRDILMMTMLGTTAAASAFLLAFTVPNLFRRLLGEGALTSALIPVFSETLQEEGQDSAFRFFSQVMAWTLRWLLGLMLLGGVVYGLVYWLVVGGWGPTAGDGAFERYTLGCLLGILLLPYLLLVCLAAAQGAVLNVLQRFAIHALSPVWLNLAMILALLVGGWLVGLGPTALAVWLSLAVLAGGVIQWWVPARALRQAGWKSKVELDDPAGSARMDELRRIFFPALGGAAIMQVNILVSRLLGFSLSDAALPALYLAGRLIELPLGVFAITVVTVLFPRFSLEAASGQAERLANSFGQGFRMIQAVLLPSTVGLMVLSGSVLGLLFEWGRFDASDVLMTQPILMLFALTMPFYGAAILAARGFHAMKDMRSPVRVAAWAFGVNLLLSVVLMIPLGVYGLALANLVAAALQATLLLARLSRVAPQIPGRLGWLEVGKATVASLVMGLVCWAGILGWGVLLEPGKIRDLVEVMTLIPLGVVAYALALWLLRYRERREALELVKGVLKRKRDH